MSRIAGLNDRPERVVINGWLGPADQLSCEVRTAVTKCDGAATKRDGAWPRVLRW